MKSRKSVLVVDDDFALRNYLFIFLTSSGLDVVTAESGEEAISHLKSGYSPSLMILDMVLPGMDGIDVLNAAKEINAFLPVIVLSGSEQAKTVVHAMQAGAVDFLTKPINDDELSLAIRNVFDEQERNQPV